MGDGGWASSQGNGFEYYRKHLSNAKECTVGKDCFGHNFKMLGIDRFDDTHANDGINIYWSGIGKGLILADGVQVIVGQGGIYPFIIVDLNGKRKPNEWGRDGFWFYIGENGLFPRGCNNENSNECPGTYRGNMGKGCACKVLSENAMNY